MVMGSTNFKVDEQRGRGELKGLNTHRNEVTAASTFNKLFKFSFSSPPCLRGWVWTTGSWKKRWETWLIRRSLWPTGRPRLLRSSNGEYSALMSFCRIPAVCGRAVTEFLPCTWHLQALKVKSHTRLGFCSGFAWDFNNIQIWKIVILLKSESVLPNTTFLSAGESWPLGVACGFGRMLEGVMCWAHASKRERAWEKQCLRVFVSQH